MIFNLKIRLNKMDYSDLKSRSNLAAIEGKVYDLNKFSDVHPGGKDILLYVGRNATPHFHMHHPHMKPEELALKLKKYYVCEYKETNEDCGDIYYYDSPFAVDLLKSTAEYFKTHDKYASWWGLFKVALIVSMYFYTTYRFVVAPSYTLAIIYGIANYFLSLCVMHTANHGGFSKYPLVNTLLGLSMNLLLSDRVWWMKGHHVNHHAYVSDYKCDPDESNVEPVLITNPHSTIKRHKIFKVTQLVNFLIVISLFPILQFFNIENFTLKRYPGTPVTSLMRNQLPITILIKLLTIAMYIKFFMTTGFVTGIKYILIFSYIATFLSVAPFELSHHFEGNKKNMDRSQKRDWYKEQIESSCDYGGSISNCLSGGLSSQTVHHIFPRVDQDHYPALRKIMMEVCRRHNVRYTHFPNIIYNIISTVKYVMSLDK